MQLTGQNNGGTASRVFLLVSDMCKETNFNGSNSNDPSVFLFCATESIDLTAYTSTQWLRECIKSSLFGSVKLIAKLNGI